MTQEPAKPTQPEMVPAEEFNKAQERARNFEAKLTDLEKRFKGVDPEEARALREEVALLRKDAAGGDPKKIDDLIARERGEIEKRFSSKLTETESALSEAQKRLKRAEVVNPALMTAAKFFNNDALPLLQPVLESALDFEDGKIVVKQDGRVVPSVKNPRIAAMPLEEFLESLVEKHPSLAKPTLAAGGKEGVTRSLSSSFGQGQTISDFAKMPDRGKEAFKNMKIEDLKKVFSK